MAAVLGKNFRLPQTCSRILTSNLRQGYTFRLSRLPQSLNNYGKTENRFLSSAVQKLAVQEELTKNNFLKNTKTNEDLLKAIDDTFAQIDSTLRRSGRTRRWNVEAVINLIKKAGTISNAHGLFLLRCCERMLEESPSDRIKLSDEIWFMLQNYGMELEVSHFNSRLKLYVDNQGDFSPGEFLSLMESHGIEPNKVTFVLLLEKFCNDGNLSGASEILEFMKEKNIPVTEKTFNIIIKGHLNSNDYAGAENILEVMRASNLTPNSDSYAVLLCGYAKKDVEEMKSYLAKIQNMGVFLLDKHILQVVKALAMSGHEQLAFEVFGMMKNVSNNQPEILNTSIELTHCNLEDVSCKLLLASCDSDQNSGTNVFVRHMIRKQKPAAKIFAFCKDVYEKGINDYILLNASKSSLDHGMIDLTLMLYDEMHKKGLPIRQFNMYPVFSYYKENKLAEDAWVALKKIAEFGILPNFGFYRQHIIPALNIKDVQSFLKQIQENNLPVAAVVDPLFDYCCFHGNINDALKLSHLYPVQVNDNFRINAYLSHNKQFESNPEAYFKVLKYVIEHVGLSSRDRNAIQGVFLAESIQANPTMVDEFRKKTNCKVGNKSLTIAKEILLNKAPQYMVYLKRFEDPKLEIATTSRPEMTIEKEKEQLCDIEAKGLSCQSFLVDRLMHHMKKRNIDRVSEIKLLLEESGFQFTAVMCAQLIGIFSEANDLEKVESLMQYLKENYPTFKVDLVKALEYATLLLKYGKFDKFMDTLKCFDQNPSDFENKSLVQRSIRKLLNATAETGNIDLVKKVQDVMVSQSYNVANKETFLEPLIKVYVLRNELEEALECYKNALKQYHSAPCLSVLLNKCIVHENQEGLQKIVDLTSKYLGKTIAICELAAAFVEASRPEQGFQALQNLDYKSERDGSYLLDICWRLHNKGKVNELRQFIAITRELKHSNREKMYHLLLNLYTQKNLHENALEVYKLMEKEEIHPSERTLSLLHDLFQRNNQLIPKSINEHKASISRTESEDTLEHSETISSDFKIKFVEYVNNEEFTLALDEMNKMKKGHVRLLTIDELSKFIELLLKKKCLLDLSPNVQVMSYVIEHTSKIFRPLLEKCANVGDIEAIKTVYSFLPDFALRKVAFNNYFARAFCARGKHEDLLLELEKNCESSNKFFSIFAIQELLKIPHLEERALKLCKKHLSLDFDLPISVAFAHYFVSQNYAKVEEMIKDNGISIDKIHSLIVKEIRQTENVSMGKKFIEILKTQTVVNRTKERAYGVLLDVLVSKEMYSEAGMLVSEAESQNLPLDKYHSSTLITLKNALEKENKPVTFNIPSENSDSAMFSRL